jgi:hypothetical protein
MDLLNPLTFWFIETSMKMRIGIILFLIVFLGQSILLPRVGMTWDEPSSFFIGRANLLFWLTRDRSYVTDIKNPEKFKDQPFQYIFGEDIYPPFPFVVASAFSMVLAERFHVVDVYTAHHMGIVFIGALGVVALYGIGLSIGLSTLASFGLAAIAATYPTIVGQMRNDAKDVPLMSMICIFIFFFLQFINSVKKKEVKKQVIFGFTTAIVLGLTEATKVSAAIMVPIVGLWFLISLIFFPAFRRKMKPLPLRVVEGGLFGALSLATFIFVWPWLWDDPVGKLTIVWNFFKTVGYNMPTLYFGKFFHAGINLPKEYPFALLGVQTPPSVLFLMALGLLLTVFRILKRRDAFAVLPLLWLIIGMGRFFVPGIIIYAKVRHFIDVMPAFFLIVGIGLDEIGRIRIPRLPKGAIAVLLLTIGLVHQIVVSILFFPYEPSYFNVFTGGSKKVADERLFDIEYWASGVKEAMEYIEKTDPGPIGVYGCMMGHVARFYENKTTTVKRYGSLSRYTIVPNSASWFGQAIDFLKTQHELVYTIKRNGADLFYIFRHKAHTVWICGNETLMNYEL